MLHPSDAIVVEKLKGIKSCPDLLLFIRDYELYPEYYEAHPGRKEYIELLIEKIDELIPTP